MFQTQIITVATALTVLTSGCISEQETQTTSANIGSTSTVASDLAALAKDPDYVALLAKVSAVTNTMTATLSLATAAERSQLRGYLAVLQIELENSDPEAVAFPEVITQVTGLSQEALQELQVDASALAIRYPTLAATIAQLGQSAPLQYSMEYTFHSIEPCTTDECECTEECEQEYQSELNKIGFTWVGALWGFAPLGIFVGTIAMIDQSADAFERLLECIEGCTGDSLGGCDDDSDCPSDQFCSKPLGNPYHSCRDKKELGKVCSRDGKCASGCCKYHFFTNPFSMVCRPADKCN